MQPLYAQADPPVLLDSIYAITRDPDSQFFVQKLLGRFHSVDSLLNSKEVFLLYHGYSGQSFHTPLRDFSPLANFFSALRSDDLQYAIKLGEQLHQNYPLDLRLLFGLYSAFSALNHTDKIKEYQFKVRMVFEAIRGSGTGAGKDKAFIVLYPSDAALFVQMMAGTPNKPSEREGSFYIVPIRNDSRLGTSVYFFIPGLVAK